MFEALANAQRRQLLVALLDQDPQQEGLRLPEDIHEGEKALDVLQTELHHLHLPQLEEAGFIEWERDSHKATKGPRFDEIQPLLRFIQDRADELPRSWA